MKTSILLILLLFSKMSFAQQDSLIKTVINITKPHAINKDSIRHTAVDKGSKYLSFSVGMVYAIKDGKYITLMQISKYRLEIFQICRFVQIRASRI